MSGFLDEEEYHRQRETRRLRKEAADRLTNAIRDAMERLGSVAAARDFMNNSNSLLGGSRPVDVAGSNDEGLEQVKRLLRHMDAEHASRI